MLNEVDVSKLEGTFVLLYKLNNDKVCRLLPVTDKILGKMLIEENVCVDVTVEDLRKCVRDKNIEVLNVYISSGGSILEKKLHFPILIDVYLMNAVKIRNRVVNSNVVGNIQDSKDWNLENSLKWL